VRVDSVDLLQSVTKEVAMFLLLLVCVGSPVLGFKMLCFTSVVCEPTNNDTKAWMIGRSLWLKFVTGKTEYVLERRYVVHSCTGQSFRDMCSSLKYD
jgi:hypothetical protein